MKQNEVNKIITALEALYLKLVKEGKVEELRKIRIELEDWNNYN